MKRILLTLLAIFAMTGCSRIANINTITSDVYANHITHEQVHSAIYKALKEKEWTVRDLNSNTIEAQINPRGHQAVVEITYNTKQYTINYKSSSDMRYNKEKNTIHRNYNRWVHNLDEEIQRQISFIAVK